MDRSVLVGVAEIAGLFGVSRQAALELARATRRLPNARGIVEEWSGVGAAGHTRVGGRA